MPGVILVDIVRYVLAGFGLADSYIKRLFLVGAVCVRSVLALVWFYRVLSSVLRIRDTECFVGFDIVFDFFLLLIANVKLWIVMLSEIWFQNFKEEKLSK